MTRRTAGWLIFAIGLVASASAIFFGPFFGSDLTWQVGSALLVAFCGYYLTREPKPPA